MVEDGRPFCPKCHAPQIRVPVRPPTAPVTEPLLPGTPEDLQPPAEPMMHERDAPAPTSSGAGFSISENKLQWRPAISSALIAGMLAAVGTSVGVVPLAMLCMFAAGGLAVTLYRRRAGHHAVGAWMGAKVGMLAGGWGFGLLALLSAIQLFSASRLTELHRIFQEKMQEMMATNTEPETRQTLEQFRDYLGTDHGLIVVSLIGIVILGIVFVGFSALGGVLGAVLFGRERGRKEL